MFKYFNIQKIHGDEAVECEICGKKFGRSYNLRRHMMTHTGYLRFPWHKLLTLVCNVKFYHFKQ